ncbi:MAG: RtcB family protein, partial [Rhizobiaceae bacterium]
PGRWFNEALAQANQVLAAGGSMEQALATARGCAPPPVLPLHAVDGKPLHANIEAESDEDSANIALVTATMRELLRTPVVKAGSVMPDACPSGGPGTIPVGGIAVSEAIHPGMHSADICCSMALSNFGFADPAAVLDAVHAVTHFGPVVGERDATLPTDMAAAIAGNRFLRKLQGVARQHFATQGDGNHFASVGRLSSSGETVLVTHHGSRGLGARLYKAGMDVAERFRLALSPETRPANAWIPAETPDGEAYWEALQIVRGWTRASHFAIHDRAANHGGLVLRDRYWNEHNFVFRRADGLFYHAKGATPAFAGWAEDATDLTIIPLNMAEPILIVRGSNAPHSLGFSPHGAGRNVSRTAHKRRLGGRSEGEVFAAETARLDVRFYSGEIDVSELPSAYKDATSVRRQIGRFGLAEIVDEVVPYGSIMAGDWERNAPWRNKPRA